MASSRVYDIVLLGATGYTGKFCAEHITTHLPTNLKWAVAGRSHSKLQDLVSNIHKLNPDRRQPELVQLEINQPELDALARKTKVLLNCIGPYHIYSTPVVAACARNGTHYLDVTGETPWVREVIQEFHETAQSNHAVLIPEIGAESAPSDILAYVAVKTIRDNYSCGVTDVTCSMHDIQANGLSGGTLATILSVMDNYSQKDLMAARKNPYILSPRPAPPKDPSWSSSRGWLRQLFGVFTYPGLGILTTGMTAVSNAAIVHRSAGLMPDFYGQDFHFSEYIGVAGYIPGILVHFAVVLGGILLALRPMRRLAKRFVYQPGQGPEIRPRGKDVFDCRAVAVAENGKKVMTKFRYPGGTYYMTGLLLAEAAMVLLRDERLVTRLGGGVLTPACLGDGFVEALQRADIEIVAELI